MDLQEAPHPGLMLLVLACALAAAWAGLKAWEKSTAAQPHRVVVAKVVNLQQDYEAWRFNLDGSGNFTVAKGDEVLLSKVKEAMKLKAAAEFEFDGFDKLVDVRILTSLAAATRPSVEIAAGS